MLPTYFYKRQVKAVNSNQRWYATIATLCTIMIIVTIYEWEHFQLHKLWYAKKPTFSGHYNASAKYLIPTVCYQTWMTKDLTKLSNTTREVIAENKALNPYIDFQLWDDDDVENFMKTEFAGTIYDAFKTINPKFGAARADFFRYCVLYKRGGLYLDIKSMLRIKDIFGQVIQPNDECVLDRRKKLEPHRTEWDYGTYEQWFLAFKPEHPYLRRMIERMTRSIKERIDIPDEVVSDKEHTVKYKVMRITGPDALAVAIHDAIVDVGVHHREVDYKLWVKYSKVVGNPEYKLVNVAHYNDVKEPFYLESISVSVRPS